MGELEALFRSRGMRRAIIMPRASCCVRAHPCFVPSPAALCSALVAAPIAVRAADPPPCPSAEPQRATPLRATTAAAAAADASRPAPKRRRRSTCRATRPTIGVNGDGHRCRATSSCSQGEREIRADERPVRPATSSAIKVEGDIDYTDPLVHVTGRRRQLLGRAGCGVSTTAEFELRAARRRAARPAAAAHARGRHQPQGRDASPPARSTTTSWQHRRADDIVARHAHAASARGTRRAVEFKGVPILYLPWMSFPLGSERKSGFLFPTLGHTDARRPAALGALLLEHRAERGPDLRAHRLQSRAASTSAATCACSRSARAASSSVNFLPNDDVAHRDRSRFKLENVGKLPGDLRFHVDAGNVSDTQLLRGLRQRPGRHERAVR